MKILVADDHEVVRQGVKQILADEFPTVSVGEVGDAAALLRRMLKEKWDLVLVDINMPGRNGLEAITELRKERPQVPVLVLSMYAEQEYALRALKAGAAGYLNKKSLSQELIAAVKKVLAGGRYITTTLADLLAEDLNRPGPLLLHRSLSDREYEVMKLLAIGKSVKEIAGELKLGEKTVFTYRIRLLQKLRLKGDVEVARYALQHGLVE